MSELIEVMEALYKSEISCGMSSFWDGGFTIWIGDDINGKKDESSGYYPNMMDEAAEWLHNAAIKYYPRSAYAVLCEPPTKGDL